MKIKDSDIDDLCDYLEKLNVTAGKLAVILKDNDINGSHLESITSDIINELCPTIGLKLEFKKLINNRENEIGWDDENNSDKHTKKPASINVCPHHSGISCLVKNERQPETEIKISSHGFDFSKLNDGSYNAKFIYSKDLSSPIVLKECTFNKSGTTITPSFLDLSSSFVALEFNTHDKPARNCDLTGQIKIPSSTVNGAATLNINSKTNDQGKYSMIMPQGSISLNVNGIVDGKPVDIKEKICIEPSVPVKTIDEAKLIQPVSVTNSIDCSTYIVKYKGSKIHFLFDISGSMGFQVKDKIQILRLKEWALSLINTLNISYSFSAWDTTSFMALDKQWSSTSNKPKLESWVNELKPRGGNNMKQAIEKAIDNYPDADEFVICCDGDVTPFNLMSWKEFSSSYGSKYMFTFVGIGSNSDELMKQMAQIGRGSFFKVE